MDNSMSSIFDTCTSYDQLGLSDLREPLTRALEATKSLVGDYYEFGLYAGSAFHYVQREAARLGFREMNFWGFDSFQGLPQGHGEEANFGPGGNYACDRATVEALHNRFGVDWSRVHLIEGFYDTSLTDTLALEKGMKKASVVLVDCDVYVSSISVLKFIRPLLQDGTIIIFDDWGTFGDDTSEAKGEKKAFREFLLQHPEWRADDFLDSGWNVYRYLQKSFVMRKS